jgi:hypothetical protein
MEGGSKTESNTAGCKRHRDPALRQFVPRQSAWRTRWDGPRSGRPPVAIALQILIRLLQIRQHHAAALRIRCRCADGYSARHFRGVGRQAQRCPAARQWKSSPSPSTLARYPSDVAIVTLMAARPQPDDPPLYKDAGPPASRRWSAGNGAMSRNTMLISGCKFHPEVPVSTHLSRKELKQDNVALKVEETTHFLTTHRPLVTRVGVIDPGRPGHRTWCPGFSSVPGVMRASRRWRPHCLCKTLRWAPLLPTAAQLSPALAKSDAVRKAFNSIVTQDGGSEEAYAAEYYLAGHRRIANGKTDDGLKNTTTSLRRRRRIMRLWRSSPKRRLLLFSGPLVRKRRPY